MVLPTFFIALLAASATAAPVPRPTQAPVAKQRRQIDISVVGSTTISGADVSAFASAAGVAAANSGVTSAAADTTSATETSSSSAAAETSSSSDSGSSDSGSSDSGSSDSGSSGSDSSDSSSSKDDSKGSATSTSSSSESSSTAAASTGDDPKKADKQIIVAPQQGVLRFVPFATKAKPGQVINFQWGGGPHTVTRSSQLEICNKSLADNSFSSGEQEAGFNFNLAINDTAQTFFYCGVQPHCELGMFGVLNQADALVASSSAATLISTLAENDKDIATLLTQTNAATNGTAAAKWAENMDVSNFPAWSHKSVAENVLNTRQYYAQNLDKLPSDE